MTTMNYMMSDISLEEKDVIQSIGRRAFLQFTTLDYLISKSYEAIAKIYNETRFSDGASTDLDFNNPYQLNTCVIEWLMQKSFLEEVQHVPDAVAGR